MNIYSFTSLLASIFCISIGTFVYLSKGLSRRRKLFSFATVMTGLWTLLPFLLSVAPDERMALFFARLTHIPASLTPAAWMHFMLSITRSDEARERRRPLLLAYTASLLFLSVSFSPLFVKGTVRFAPNFSVIPGPLYPFFMFIFGVIFVYIVCTVFKNFHIAQGYAKNQLKYILLSYLFGFLSGILYFGAVYLRKEPFPHDIFLIVYAGLAWYSIFQYKIMDLEHAITLIMAFAIVCIPIIAVPFVVGYVTESWLLCGLFATIFAPIGVYVYSRVKRKVITERLVFQEAVMGIIEDVKHVRLFEKLFSMLSDQLVEKLKLTHIAIYQLDVKNKKYVLRATKKHELVKAEPGERYVVHADTPLIDLLFHEKEPIVYEELKSRFYDTRLEKLKGARKIIEMMNAVVIIPVFYQDKKEELVAFLALGERLSGKPYSMYDIKAMKSLAEHIALAIKNAQFMEDLNAAHVELLQASTKKHLAEMADGMSHQFHNRFIGITFPAGFAKDILTKVDIKTLSMEDRDRIKKAIDAMGRAELNAVKGGEIARGLLKFSRPDKEGFRMVNIGDGIRLAVEMVEYKHPDFSQIKFETKESSALPHTWASMAYLQDMYFIAIDNAYDAIKNKMAEDESFKGKIIVSVASDRSKKNIHITIKDNGTGMDPDILEKVKAAIPYVTTKASSDKSGYGAGVHMLRRFVELHDGRLMYDSTRENGTTVTIDIPITKKRQAPVKIKGA